MNNVSAAVATGDHVKLFARPLVVGASVSADYFTASPGKRLAQRLGHGGDIRVVARGGEHGANVLKLIRDEDVRDRSVVIGMDLFFWDSLLAAPTESLRAMERLVELTAKNGTPLVLGEIPNLMPAMQPGAEILNRRMRELCEAHAHCRILPLQALLLKTLREGYLSYKGSKYPLEVLLPDGLHIAEPASEFLADQILALL